MKVSAGEGVKSCGIHTSLWTWESHIVRHFRFRHAVDVAIKQVGMFSLCFAFICFCNHSSRSWTERDQFVFGCFYRSTAWELRLLSTWEFYHDLTHRRFRGAVDFAIEQRVSISKCFYLLDVFICLWFANEGVKISIKFFSTDVAFFPVHITVLK